MKKVSVRSDGTSRGTFVFDADGNAVRGVTGVHWVCEGRNRIAQLDISLEIMDLSAHGQARFLGPGGKEIARIIYADGSEDDYRAEATTFGGRE